MTRRCVHQNTAIPSLQGVTLKKKKRRHFPSCFFHRVIKIHPSRRPQQGAVRRGTTQTQKRTTGLTLINAVNKRKFSPRASRRRTLSSSITLCSRPHSASNTSYVLSLQNRHQQKKEQRRTITAGRAEKENEAADAIIIYRRRFDE